MKRIYIGGASGVGKSELTERTRDLGAAEGVQIAIVHVSSVITDIAKLFRRDWETMPEMDKNAIIQMAWDRIHLINADNLINDAHYAYKHEGLYFPALPKNEWQMPDKYVLVKADPQTIRERRKNNMKKARDLVIPEIKYESSVEEHIATAITTAVHKRLYIIEDNSIEKAAKHLLDIIRH